MSKWKQLVLAIYLAASRRARLRAHREAADNGKCPISILFYHRVADFEPNDWTISNSQFLKQIDWLEENCEIISLYEAQQRIKNGVNRKRAVCITFDDGYADNCLEALPMLIRRDIPFTYFVATNHVAKGIPFPHDVKAGTPLATNTIDQIQALANAGVEIGAHTRNHADLGLIQDEDQLVDELIGSKEDIESWTGEAVRYFAFPYGQTCNLNTHAVELAKISGLLGVCSAYGGYNFPGDSSYHLQRIHGDPEMVRLENWLTVDPRKFRIEKADIESQEVGRELLGEPA